MHAADLHLDTPFEGLGRVAPGLAAELRDASLAAFDRLIDLTLAEDAAFLLLAGDIYDGAERGIRAQIRFAQGLARLAERGIPTFIVHGNHDPLDGWSAIRRWPEGVVVFGAEQAASVPVVRDGTTLAIVHGISYPQRDVAENLARRFRRQDGGGLQIGLLHCLAGASGEHAAYSPCTLDDLREAGFDYWALGHVHARQILAEGAPWVVYPGNLQGRKAAERGAKGAVVVTVEDGVVADVAFRPTDVVRFDQVELDIGGVQDVAALMDALSAEAEIRRGQAEGRALVLRGLLTGRGALHADLARPGALDALVTELRNAAAGLEPFLWWERLVDASGGLIDRARIRERGDFSAELLAMAERLAEDEAELQRFAAHAWGMLEQMGIPAPPPDEMRALADQAATLALEMLEAVGDR